MDARPNTYYGPTDTGSGYSGADGRFAPDVTQPDAMLTPARNAGVDGSSDPGGIEPGTADGNSVPHMGNRSTLDINGMMGPSMMGR